jgi:hypothetical protein
MTYHVISHDDVEFRTGNIGRQDKSPLLPILHIIWYHMISQYIILYHRGIHLSADYNAGLRVQPPSKPLLDDIIWHHMTSHDVIWRHMIPNFVRRLHCSDTCSNSVTITVIWHQLTSYDILWYHMMSYDIIYIIITTFGFFCSTSKVAHMICHMMSYDVRWYNVTRVYENEAYLFT